MKKAYWVDWDATIFTEAKTLDRAKVEEIFRSFPEGVDIRYYGWKNQVDKICDLVVDERTTEFTMNRIVELQQENKSLKVYKATAEERIKELEKYEKLYGEIYFKHYIPLEAKLKVAEDALDKILKGHSVAKQPAKIVPLNPNDNNCYTYDSKINEIIAHINKEA